MMLLQRVDGLVCTVGGKRSEECMLVGEACDCMVWCLWRCKSLGKNGNVDACADIMLWVRGVERCVVHRTDHTVEGCM